MAVIQPFGLQSGRAASITYGVELENLANAQAAIDDIADEFRDRWLAVLDSNVQVRTPFAYYRPVSLLPVQLVTSTLGPVQGALAATSEVPSVALGITKRTNQIGRKNRGRMYMPGVLSDANTDEGGNITPANVTTFQNICNTWLPNLASRPGIVGMVLLHSYISQVLPDTPVIADPELPSEPITNLVVRSVVRTQRRRLPRGG